jgi:hypothetical protein
MDGVGTAVAGSVENPLGVQIALSRRGRPEQHAPIGLAHVGRIAIGLGVDGDGGEAGPPTGAEDPAGDLSPVGDEDGAEH